MDNFDERTTRLHSMSIDTDWNSHELTFLLDNELDCGFYCNLRFVPVTDIKLRNMIYHVHVKIGQLTKHRSFLAEHFEGFEGMESDMFTDSTLFERVHVLSIPLKPGVIQKTSTNIILHGYMPSPDLTNITIVMEANENKSRFKLVFGVNDGDEE